MATNEGDKAYRYVIDVTDFFVIEEYEHGMCYCVLDVEAMRAGHVTLNEEHPDVMICMTCETRPLGGDCIHEGVVRYHLKMLHRGWEKPKVYDLAAMARSSRLVVTPEKMSEQELDFIEQDADDHPLHYQSWVKESVVQERERRKMRRSSGLDAAGGNHVNV